MADKPHEKIYEQFRGLEPDLTPTVITFREKVEKDLPDWFGRYAKILYDARLALAQRYAEAGAYEQALEHLNKLRQEIASQTAIAVGAEAKADEIKKKGLRGEERLTLVSETGGRYMRLSDEVRDAQVEEEVAKKKIAGLEARLADL